MKIVFGSTSQTETLTMSQLMDGHVYTDVSDELDDDLYIATDQGGIVNLRNGVYFADGDLPTSRFLEVDVELVVKK